MTATGMTGWDSHMSSWDSQIIQRFKALLNISDTFTGTSAEGTDGDSEDAKLKRAALARNLKRDKAETAHEVLTTLAFSGYQDWCAYDDDAWTKNCLAQVFDADQSGYLAERLQDTGLDKLQEALTEMADSYASAWQQAAENEAAQAAQAGATVTAAGLIPAENAASWEYSRTPGTRYYIFLDGEYLYSDDKNALVQHWATADTRDEEAAQRATEWESGSGIYYTSYDNPAHVAGVTHVFGRSRYGPWNLDRAQATRLLAQPRQAQAPSGVTGQGNPIEPYYDTGHYTKYDNGTYYYGKTRDATTWYPTYQQLLDTLAGAETTTATAAPEQEADRDALIELMLQNPHLISASPGEVREFLAANGLPVAG